MNIILFNCSIQSGNKGCSALCISVLYILDEILTKKGIKYSLYLPQSGHPSNGKYTIKINNKLIEYNACNSLSNGSLKFFLKNIISLKKFISTYQIYKDADYCFDIGQGDSFSDIYGKHRFNLIFSQRYVCMIFHKHFCYLPQTVGPFYNTSIRQRASNALQRADSIFVRDKQSAYYVKQLSPASNPIETVDVAFFLPYKKFSFNSNNIHVGLNISALLWNGGYTSNNQFNLNIDYQDLIRKVITFFLHTDNVILHLIPHVVSSEKNIENDYEISYNLWKEFHDERLLLAPFFFDPIEAKSYIAGMDFFMGARMHSTIAAFSSAVPVLPMAYSRKFNGLFIDTLEYEWVTDLTCDSLADCFEKIKYVFDCRAEIKNNIAKILSTTVAKYKDVFLTKLAEYLNIN